MSTALIFGLIGGLLVLAFLANRLSRLTRIPDVLMLMALGVVIGPGLHLADPTSLTGATNLLGALAIILVLFEGGLELKLRLASTVPDGEPVAVAAGLTQDPIPNPAAVVESASRRWILHASLLFLLALSALLLWYSKHPERRGIGRVQQWWPSRAVGGK
ncbi:MAG TPA: cation:proton antiporter [Terriglobales bacterium]|jgi:Kef-type K+ transport system membrane component KefB|nr:cation:proton antiporter [Terriglobales bacterium]